MKRTQIDQILDAFREFVIRKKYQNTPVLTVYVDTDPTNPRNHGSKPAGWVDLKNEAGNLKTLLPEQEFKRKESQEKWNNTTEKIMEYLLNRKTMGRSVVLFTDHEDMIAMGLPVRLPTRIYYGFPQLKHFLFALDEYKKYLVILFASYKTRLVEVFLTRSTDELIVETRHDRYRKFGRKSKTQASERRDAEFERRFVYEMAQEISHHFLEDHEFERLVFGGNLKLAGAIKDLLHPIVAERVVALEAIDYKSSEHKIAKKIKQIAEQKEREHDLFIINDLLNKHRSNGMALLEQQSIENALYKGALKKLVIPYPIDSGRFDELIIQSVKKKIEIEFVYGEGAEKLNQYGGIGAYLDYSNG